jgi:hypothetical protein
MLYGKTGFVKGNFSTMLARGGSVHKDHCEETVSCKPVMQLWPSADFWRIYLRFLRGRYFHISGGYHNYGPAPHLGSAMSYQLLTAVTLLSVLSCSYGLIIPVMIKIGVPGKSAVGSGWQ